MSRTTKEKALSGMNVKRHALFVATDNVPYQSDQSPDDQEGFRRDERYSPGLHFSLHRQVSLDCTRVALHVRHAILPLIYALCTILSLGGPAFAESPAPTVHWGGIAYPDQFNTLTIGGTFNRFTEFDGEGTRYNSTLNESLGLNFATVSWSQHWERFEGWSTNITIGAGPTGSQPTKFAQNNIVHTVLGYAPVVVGQTRSDVDAMVSASVTRWFPLFDRRKELYIGGGVTGGTLYQEAFARAGLRRVSFDSLIPYWDRTPLRVLTDYLRFSAMARYGQLETGAVLHQIKPYSFLYQLSTSLGPYGKSDGPPHWEIEYAMTWDSGIFVDQTGQSRKELFWSLAFAYDAFRFESWNDSINRKDKGPTYGFTVTLDLFRLFKKEGGNTSPQS